ncbi:hypothetical protein PLCT1_02696 [Planctomycetaceae bacterium]|nr:hypothetical protein PLCT1_02696 [Planctomycetaceae bacterium]
MQPYQYTHYIPLGSQPAVAPKPRQFAPTDHSAVAISGAGLAIVITTWLPVGLITAPIAFARIRAFEAGVAEGRFNPVDQCHFNAARVMAWISVVLSLPSVLLGALFLALALAH